MKSDNFALYSGSLSIALDTLTIESPPSDPTLPDAAGVYTPAATTALGNDMLKLGATGNSFM